MSRSVRTLRLAAIAAGLAVAAAACSPSAAVPSGSGPSGTAPSGTAPVSTADPTVAPSAGLTTVTLRQSWIPDDLYLPYAMAIGKGYYEAEGINLVMQVGNGGATAAKLVANGNVMIGTGEAANVIVARSQGLPVVSVAVQIQDTPAAVIALKSSGISTWKDLVGKKVAGTAASSTTVQFNAALKLQGIDPASVEFVNLPANAQFQALQAGQVDAALTFIGNIFSLPNQGGDLSVMTFKSAGLEAPSTSIFVSEEFLAGNKDLLAGFLRATLKGLKDAIANPAEAAEFMAAQFALVNQDDVLGKWKLNEPFFTSSVSQANGLGFQDLARWQALEKVLLEGDNIKTTVDVTKAFTNEIVESIPKQDR